MPSEVTARWIEAARVFATEITAKVLCPECGKSWLNVQDSASVDGVKERRLFCGTCGKHQFLRMKA